MDQLHVSVRNLRPHHHIEFIAQLCQVKPFTFPINNSRLNLRKIQNVIDKSQQQVIVGLDDMPILLLFIRVVTVDQQFGEPSNGVQRSTYFMTHIGQKCRLQPVGELGLILHFFQFLSHFFPLRIVESDTGIANDVSLLVTFRRKPGNNQCLPILIPFGTRTILKRELLILPGRHANHIFTNTFRILRMGSFQIILGYNCFFGIKIIHRIIE